MCTGIQGISARLPREVHLPKCVHLPNVVYWYSRHLCSICGGVQPKKVCLTSTSLASRWGSIGQRRFVCQVLVSLVGGGGPSAKEGSSAKFELTYCFMLCFKEGLFVLHTKDLVNAIGIVIHLYNSVTKLVESLISLLPKETREYYLFGRALPVLNQALQHISTM